MKKILIAGIVIFFALFMVTCEADLSEGEIEYTDVVYSPDGSQVTVYLDGATVPVTKEQRSMSRDLAMMFYDYLEVIFIGGGVVARASWELGSPAGISGVWRNGTAAGFNYDSVTAACMFVGKKSDKTLLGVGKITNVEPEGTGGTNFIGTESRSVTFSLAAIETGLLVAGTDTTQGVGPTHDRGVIRNSFKYIAAGSATDYTALTEDNSKLQTLGGIKYPQYSLPKVTTGTATVNAEFELFFRGTVDYTTAVKHFAQTTPTIIGPSVQKRTPRYMYGGAYLEPKNFIDTATTVAFRTPYTTLATTPLPAHGTNLETIIPLTFVVNSRSNGIFSFQFQIPVFNNNFAKRADASTPLHIESTEPIRWYIRSGLGSEYYSLDDGASSGGCVLMNVGTAGSSDWLDIYWDWI